MKKKKSSGGGANWMDTYGDMVTLLLCFFVLLYSMSTISEDNWRAIVMSFNPNAVSTPTESSGNNGPIAEDVEDQESIDAAIDQLYEALKEYVADQGAESTISVTKGDGKVYVSFNQTVFFDGDSPVLRKESEPVLDAVSGMLTEAAFAIDEVRILGHTAQGEADTPNNPQVDRTLSSQRATNVLVYIQEHSEVDPARLISEGYGQWRPVASNETAEERAKNRRVEMIVSGIDLSNELGDALQQYYT